MTEQIAHLQDLLLGWGSIDARRMFGGYGVYREGTMFALIVEGSLYLKTDVDSAPWFDARALPAFRYQRAGKWIALSYRLAPEEFWDEPAVAVEWSQRAWEAGCRRR